MKKRNVIILVVMLIVGFASITSTLLIRGNLNIGYNENFSSSIVYTRAELPNGEVEINQNDKNIDFITEKLENVNQTTILEFDVTNKSRNYDASVTINCGLKEDFKSFSEYLDIDMSLESPFELVSSETKTGYLTIKLKKAYNEEMETRIEMSCELVAEPLERETLGDEYKSIYKEKILNGADPVLKEKLIPVEISNNGEVRYADISKEWYKYENKEWANAVILNEGVSYQEGDIISESDIESYFVWIPRYKYQIFDEGNYTETIQSKPETSIAKEIQIEFETNEVESSTGSKVNEWLTHPAFTNFDVNGLWVGKFETGYKGATSFSSAQVNVMDSSKVIIKPNVYSWRNSTVSNIFKTAYNYSRELDSHMMKNTEWGAVAFLSHSKYGINTEVRINNNSNYLTGYAATDGTDQSSSLGKYGTTSDITLPYNTETGHKASTTGNITGIYDMSGGAWEYVAGYVRSASDQSGFTFDELNIYSKYLDLYPTNSTRTSYNNRILGDATGEMGPFYNYADKDNIKRYHNNWYSDYSFFIDSSSIWFNRGGYYADDIIVGPFSFARFTGGIGASVGFRLVLTSKI